MKRIAILAVALLMAMMPAIGSARPAEGGGITMAVTVGYGGKYVVGKIAPVVVTIRNDGQEVAGRLELLTGSGFSLRVQRDVVLPQNTEKRFVLFVSAGSLYKAKDFEVVLMRNGAKLLSAAPVAVTAVDPGTKLCGMLTDDAAALSYMKKIIFTQTAMAIRDWVELTPETVYESAGLLDSFGVLVINGFDSAKLTQRQRDAIRQWIYYGGVLVLGAGPANESALLPWKDLLQGLEFGGSAVASDLSDLSALGQGRAFEGSLPVLSIRQDGWQAPASTPDGLPLVLRKTYGRGTLFLAAYDLGEGAVGAWQGNSLMWQPLLDGAMGQSENSSGAYYSYYSRNGLYTALAAGQAGGSVTFWVFVFLLIVFTALSGFVAFLALRAMRRQKWMWVVIPALSVLFSLLLLVSGRVGFGRSPYLFAYTHTDVTGGVARAARSLAFVAPVMGNYRLAVEDADLLFPEEFNSYDYYYGQTPDPVKRSVTAVVHADSADLEFLNVNLNGQRMARYDDFSTEPPLVVSCAYDGTDVVCKLSNTTDFPISGAVVIVGGGYKTVGEIAGRSEAEVRLKLDQTPLEQSMWTIIDQLYPYNYNVMSILDRKDDAEIRSAFAREQLNAMVYEPVDSSALGPAVCYGWLEKPFDGKVAVNGRALRPRSLELVTALVPIVPSGENGRLKIVKAYGEVNASLTQSSTAYAKGATIIVEPGNTVVVDFDLKDAGDIAVSDMFFEPGELSYSPPGSWDIYNWEASMWEGMSPERQFAGEALNRFIGADGIVRMRVTVGAKDYLECTPLVWVQGVGK